MVSELVSGSVGAETVIPSYYAPVIDTAANQPRITSYNVCYTKLLRVHNEVRMEVRDSDLSQLSATLTRDLIYPLYALNGKSFQSLSYNFV